MQIDLQLMNVHAYQRLPTYLKVLYRLPNYRYTPCSPVLLELSTATSPDSSNSREICVCWRGAAQPLVAVGLLIGFELSISDTAFQHSNLPPLCQSRLRLRNGSRRSVGTYARIQASLYVPRIDG